MRRLLVVGLSLLLLVLANNLAWAEDTPCRGITAAEQFALLEPNISSVNKQALTDRLIQEASAPHCADVGYMLGMMYRYGADLEGNPVAKDPVKAQVLIERYAREGYIHAYADLAEMHLEARNARDAMLWTQVYLYFVTRHGEKQLNLDQRHGYGALLLASAYALAQKSDVGVSKKALGQLLDSYLKPHLQEVLQNLGKERAVVQESGLKIKSTRTQSIPGLPSASRAVLLMEVLPSGTVNRIVTISYSPTPEAGRALKNWAAGMLFEPFEGAEPRYLRLPMEAGFGARSKSSSLQYHEKR